VLPEFGRGAYFRLVVTGPARGQVWFDDLASDQGITPDPEMFGRLFKLSREDAYRRAGELLERFDLAQAAGRPYRRIS
jgi:ABC-type Na+ transport system ATPase subunit NatA